MKDIENANKYLHYYKGTKIEALTQKVAKNSTTKEKGVSLKRIKGRIYYRASIQLAKKREERLFSDIDKAIKWRKQKENEIYEPLIKEFKEEV